MTDEIPFDRSFDLEPGVAKEIAPKVRALCAGNASPFTFKGTVSYIVGEGNVAIIDPGPDDERHIEALLGAVRRETVTHILLTHTHRDHSPAAAAVKAATGARPMAKVHTALRGRFISAKSIRSMLRAIWTSSPIIRCGWRDDRGLMAGRSKQLRRPAIAPITWPMR